MLPREKRQIIDLEEWKLRGGFGDLDIESTLEESPKPGAEDLRFESKKSLRVPVVLLLDTSLSMKGEKLALLAAGAVVSVLALGLDHIAVLAYDSEVRSLKHFGEEVTLHELAKRILEVPAGGFTNMERALLAAKDEMALLPAGRSAKVLLLSDGVYTEGKDPVTLAPDFTNLSVLKLGKDFSGREILQETASLGGGRFVEVRNTAELPRRMYELMRGLV